MHYYAYRKRTEVNSKIVKVKARMAATITGVNTKNSILTDLTVPKQDLYQDSTLSLMELPCFTSFKISWKME